MIVIIGRFWWGSRDAGGGRRASGLGRGAAGGVRCREPRPAGPRGGVREAVEKLAPECKVRLTERKVAPRFVSFGLLHPASTAAAVVVGVADWCVGLVGVMLVSRIRDVRVYTVAS